jgi:hypothetical protein
MIVARGCDSTVAMAGGGSSTGAAVPGGSHSARWGCDTQQRPSQTERCSPFSLRRPPTNAFLSQASPRCSRVERPRSISSSVPPDHDGRLRDRLRLIARRVRYPAIARSGSKWPRSSDDADTEFLAPLAPLAHAGPGVSIATPRVESSPHCVGLPPSSAATHYRSWSARCKRQKDLRDLAFR